MALIKGKQLADAAIVESKIADSAVTADKLSGSIPASKLDLEGIFDFSSGTLSAATPTASGHVATKGYVDGVKQSLDIKESVRVATTSELGVTYLSGVLTATANGAISIDGVALASSDRILVKNQGTANSASENGIYTVTTVGDGSNAYVLTRADDFNTDADISSGAFCFVEQGTDNGDQGFVLTTNESITLDTTDLSFTQFSGAGQISAGSGLQKDSNELSIVLDLNSGLSVSGSGLKIDGSELAAGALAVANDEILFIDSDGGTKRESVADLSTAMAGNGISANAGVLAADLKATGGLEIDSAEISVKKADSSVSSDATGLKVNLNAEGSIAIKGNAGLSAPIMATADLGKAPGAVSADGTDTTINITNTPAADGAVRIFVNGIGAELGDGVKTKDCYFSDDGGTTARSIADITAADDLFWNGASVYALDNTDVIDIVYAFIN